MTTKMDIDQSRMMLHRAATQKLHDSKLQQLRLLELRIKSLQQSLTQLQKYQSSEEHKYFVANHFFQKDPHFNDLQIVLHQNIERFYTAIATAYEAAQRHETLRDEQHIFWAQESPDNSIREYFSK
jgi:hypothetical protein